MTCDERCPFYFVSPQMTQAYCLRDEIAYVEAMLAGKPYHGAPVQRGAECRHEPSTEG